MVLGVWVRWCLSAHCSAFLGWRNKTFKDEFVIWKDSCDQVSLNRIQDVIFELHYPHQREGERKRQREKQAEMEKKARQEDWEGVMTSCWRFTTVFMIFSSSLYSTSAGLRKEKSDWTELLVVSLYVCVQSDFSHLFLSKPGIHLHCPHFVGKHNTSCRFRFI